MAEVLEGRVHKVDEKDVELDGVLLLPQVQSSGSYLVASDALGWTFTIGGLGVCAAAVVVAPRLTR